MVGSGRYTVEQYEPGQQTVLEANDQYNGEDPAQTNTAIIQYFDKASAAEARGRERVTSTSPTGASRRPTSRT